MPKYTVERTDQGLWLVSAPSGNSVCYCIAQHHAQMIRDHFNSLSPKQWGKDYSQATEEPDKLLDRKTAA